MLDLTKEWAESGAARVALGTEADQPRELRRGVRFLSETGRLDESVNAEFG